MAADLLKDCERRQVLAVAHGLVHEPPVSSSSGPPASPTPSRSESRSRSRAKAKAKAKATGMHAEVSRLDSAQAELPELLIRLQLEPHMSTWNPIVSIYLFMEAVIDNASRCCVSCGRSLTLSGMRPTLCESSLC